MLFADIAGRQLVAIPQWLGFGLLGLLVIGFAWTSFRASGSWRGLGIFFASVIAAAIIAWIGMTVMGLARPGSFWRAHPLWTHLAVYACGLLSAVTALKLLGPRLAVPQLRAAVWLGFLLLGLAVFFIAPGGVIYFLLPPFVAIVGILVNQARIGAILAAILLWLTFGEVLALLGELLNNGPMFIFAPLAAIIALPWLIECKPLLDSDSRGGAITASAALMLLGWAAAAAAPAYSADRQQRFVIQHATNAATGRAYWSVLNDGAQLPKNYGNVGGWRWDKLPYIDRSRWISPAAALADIRPPQLELIGNSANGKSRTVTFRIRPNGAESVTLVGTRDSQILSAGSDGFVRPISPDTKGDYYLQCFGRSCDGATMQFTTRVQQRMGFTLIASRRGLPATAEMLVEQRPKFARAQYSPDATMTIARVWL
jgi:hypothetical protein